MEGVGIWKDPGMGKQSSHLSCAGASPTAGRAGGLLPSHPMPPPPGSSLQRGVTGGFIVVDIDPLQLQLTVPVVAARGVDAVLIADDLPELEEIFEKWQLAISSCSGNSWPVPITHPQCSPCIPRP